MCLFVWICYVMDFPYLIFMSVIISTCVRPFEYANVMDFPYLIYMSVIISLCVCMWLLLKRHVFHHILQFIKICSSIHLGISICSSIYQDISPYLVFNHFLLFYFWVFHHDMPFFMVIHHSLQLIRKSSLENIRFWKLQYCH